MDNNGIPYFPVEVDIFDDPKVIPTMCHYGEDTERVLIRLLCSLYREGYFLEYNEAVKFSLSMKTRKDPEYIDSVIKSLVKYKFFDSELFEKFNVLTSRGIQKRWFQATRKRIRKNLEFKHWLLENPEAPDEILDQAEELGKKAEDLHKQAEDGQPKAEDGRQPSATFRQSKEKESKPNKTEKEIKEECLKRQKAFYDTLLLFVDSYPPNMLREFYDYWTEPNVSFKTLRWEKEASWDVKLRLARWAKNAKIEPNSVNNLKNDKVCKNTLPLPKEMLKRL